MCDKLIFIYTYKLLKQKHNFGLILILLIYYITDLINVKIQHFKNFLKFYTKEERLSCFGNYYIFSNLNFFTNYINSVKMLEDELLFDVTNYSFFMKHSFDFDNYQNMLKYKLNLKKFNTLLFHVLEN